MMIKNQIIKYLPFFIVTLLCSCNRSVPIEEPKSQLCIHPNLQLVLDSFINEVKPLGEVSEIYVDKINAWTYETIIYSGKGSLSNGGLPPESLCYKGATFYLYSGLEHYFYSCNSDSLLDDDMNQKGMPSGIYWIVTEKHDSIKVEREDWTIPYYSLYLKKHLKPIYHPDQRK